MTKKDYVYLTPIYAFRNNKGVLVYFPNSIGTVSEYIKAITYSDDDNFEGINKSGAI